MRVAYFINQYPAVSHTFIRREIWALEHLGVTIHRYALRPAGDGAVHDLDRSELQKTRYVLRTGVIEFLRCFLACTMRQPVAALNAVVLAVRLGWRSDRGLI